MNYMEIKEYDIANGEGVRVSLWVAGCEHQCTGCHNPHTWNHLNGKEFTIDELIELERILSKDNIAGISFTGGDPLSANNRDMIYYISTYLKKHCPTKTQWLWTGYLWEDIKHLPIMNNIDVLIDGKYEQDKRDITLKWRGSSNQRVIDVQKSLLLKEVILTK